MLGFLTSLFLPGVILGLGGPVVMLLNRLGKAGVDALSAIRSDSEASSVAKIAAAVSSRLIQTIDGVIDDAATEATGVFAKMQRPESPGGMDVTAEEWRLIREELTRRALDGFGVPWTTRLLEVVTGSVMDASNPSLVATMAKPMIAQAIESRYDERVDQAIASGIRTAPPTQFGEAPEAVPPA